MSHLISVDYFRWPLDTKGGGGGGAHAPPPWTHASETLETFSK